MDTGNEQAYNRVMDEQQNQDLALANPALIAKLEKAAEILSYVGSGSGIVDACSKAGVDYRTHQNWVKSGIYSILVGNRIQELQQMATSKVIERWPDIIQNIVDIALDKDKKNYPRDILAAATFLHDLFVQPASASQPQGSQAEKEFLDNKKKQIDWTPILGDGKKIVVTIESQDPVVDVTPPDLEGDDIIVDGAAEEDAP